MPLPPMLPDGRDLERQLCAHARCVRGLATALLRDPGAADDVAQDALVRVWQQPPRQAGALRAFLFQITRRLALRRHRSEQRRQHREQCAARAEAQGDATADAERSELLQAIAAEIA